jgi:predicted dehydrogenase
MINVCIIGYGYWGPNLCRNFSNANGYNLSTICDLNNQNLAKARKNYPGVKIYKNFKEAIKINKYDLIVLATPTSTHYTLAKFILEKSINLLVEKPLCLSVKRHSDLNKIAKRNNVKIFIDFPFIFSGSIKYVKNIIDKKKFGKLKSIESYREQAPVRVDSNVLWDLSIHDISIVKYLLGENKLNVLNIYKKNSKKFNYDQIQINISNSAGLNIFIKNNWKSPTKIRLMKFVFEQATIYCDENETLYKIKIYRSIKGKFNQHTLEVPKIDLTEPLSNLANYILKVLTKKKSITFGDNFNLSITKLMVLLDKK